MRKRVLKWEQKNQKPILRSAYPTDDESSMGPQAYGARDDTEKDNWRGVPKMPC
jgi:hypothetical protein